MSNANIGLIACSSGTAQDTMLKLWEMIKYTVRANLAIFVSQSTDANKRTKALKTEKRVYSKLPLGDQKIDNIKGKSFCLMINTY